MTITLYKNKIYFQWGCNSFVPLPYSSFLGGKGCDEPSQLNIQLIRKMGYQNSKCQLAGGGHISNATPFTNWRIEANIVLL